MPIKLIVIVMITVLMLAACGKKGPVKPKPAASQSIEIQSLPKPEKTA